jgi:hypothetical protein
MSRENAEAFINYLEKNPEVLKMLQGFTHEELKQAAQDKLDKSDGKIEPHYPI